MIEKKPARRGRPGEPVRDLLPDHPTLKSVREAADRGTFVTSPLALRVTATVHPSSVLRAPDKESRQREMKSFVSDLKRIAAWMSHRSHDPTSGHRSPG